MFARASLYVCVHACGCVAGVCSPCVDCVCTYLYTRAYVCAYVHKCTCAWRVCVASPRMDRVRACLRVRSYICEYVHACGYMWCMCIHACGGYVVSVLSLYVDRVCVRACVWVHVCV